MGLFGTVKERVKEKMHEMNPAARIEARINERKEYETSLKERMATKEEAYRNRALNHDAESRLKEKYARQSGRGGSFADRLKSGFENAGGGMFGGSEKGGGFSSPFDKMGFGGSSSGRRGRGESGGIGGDALGVLGVGGGSSRHSGGRGTTIHVHVGGSGSGKKKRTHRRGGGSGGGGFSNPMSGLGF